MTGPGSIQGQLMALRTELEAERATSERLALELATANRLLRRAVGLLRDVDKGTAGVADFLRGVP